MNENPEPLNTQDYVTLQKRYGERDRILKDAILNLVIEVERLRMELSLAQLNNILDGE